MAEALQSRIIRTEPIKWKELQFIQHDQFKELPKAAREKLKQTILENHFSDPFKVWREDKSSTTFCLDGKHRTLILEELEKDGHQVPEELPATFMSCKNKKEAAKLVLVFYKGDPKKIKEEFPEIKVEEYLQELNYQPNIALSTTG